MQRGDLVLCLTAGLVFYLLLGGVTTAPLVAPQVSVTDRLSGASTTHVALLLQTLPRRRDGTSQGVTRLTAVPLALPAPAFVGSTYPPASVVAAYEYTLAPAGEAGEPSVALPSIPDELLHETDVYQSPFTVAVASYGFALEERNPPATGSYEVPMAVTTLGLWPLREPSWAILARYKEFSSELYDFVEYDIVMVPLFERSWPRMQDYRPEGALRRITLVSFRVPKAMATFGAIAPTCMWHAPEDERRFSCSLAGGQHEVVFVLPAAFDMTHTGLLAYRVANASTPVLTHRYPADDRDFAYNYGTGETGLLESLESMEFLPLWRLRYMEAFRDHVTQPSAGVHYYTGHFVQGTDANTRGWVQIPASGAVSAFGTVGRIAVNTTSHYTAYRPVGFAEDWAYPHPNLTVIYHNMEPIGEFDDPDFALLHMRVYFLQPGARGGEQQCAFNDFTTECTMHLEYHNSVVDESRARADWRETQDVVLHPIRPATGPAGETRHLTFRYVGNLSLVYDVTCPPQVHYTAGSGEPIVLLTIRGQASNGARRYQMLVLFYPWRNRLVQVGSFEDVHPYGGRACPFGWDSLRIVPTSFFGSGPDSLLTLDSEPVIAGMSSSPMPFKHSHALLDTPPSPGGVPGSVTPSSQDTTTASSRAYRTSGGVFWLVHTVLLTMGVLYGVKAAGV